MLIRTALRLIVLIGALSCAGVAMGQNRVYDHFNDTALKVMATESPTLKREILGKSLSDMTRAIDAAKSTSLTSPQDDMKLDRVRASLQEKSDELAGTNGFDPVPDDQLNAFATYVVQDMEQAEQTITMSLVVALLIVIIILLIA